MGLSGLSAPHIIENIVSLISLDAQHRNEQWRFGFVACIMKKAVRSLLYFHLLIDVSGIGASYQFSRDLFLT